MSRFSGDHILFNECINAFRPNYNYTPNWPSPDIESQSIILTDFNLSTPWILPDCTINPSTHIRLPGAKSAFISSVKNPKWSPHYYSHLYGIALSAIISFSTGRTCKSTRDNRSPRLDDTSELSILHPVLTGGPGFTNYSLTQSTLEKYRSETAALITKLQKIPYKHYLIAMQAIRLVHLSKINKRDDFGLAYLLIVSAIESVAKHAIPRKKVAAKHPKESEWQALASTNKDFSELLSAYKEARGLNGYLKERYTIFIKEFSPISTWESINPHRFQEMIDNLDEINPSNDMDSVTQKKAWEKYPSDLDENEITKMLFDSYAHRSLFIHRGEQPPHSTPESNDRFFQNHIIPNGDLDVTQLLPNYNLLENIARHSITNWLNTIKNE